jgi:glucose/arabinose dehydrogenase
LGKDCKVTVSQPYLTAFLDAHKTLGRPHYVLPMRDGSLLVSDDDNGAIYRITYGK